MLFDPEEPEEIAAALTAVLDDPEEAAALRRAGFRRAAEFSWEKHAAALGGLFERRRHRPGAVAVAVEYILALAGFCIVSVPGLLLGALCGKSAAAAGSAVGVGAVARFAAFRLCAGGPDRAGRGPVARL